MRLYLELFKKPGVSSVIWSQLLARFAMGMQTITFAIHLQRTFNNYSIAGLAIAASTVGGAVSAPILGQWMAKFGIRPVVYISTIIVPIYHRLPIERKAEA